MYFSVAKKQPRKNKFELFVHIFFVTKVKRIGISLYANCMQMKKNRVSTNPLKPLPVLSGS